MGKVLRKTMPDENNKPTPEEEAQKQEAEAKAKADADAEAAKKQADLDAAIAAKESKKANLDKAIAEAEETLRKKREASKEDDHKDDGEIPDIDMNDPGAKAWDKRIKDTVDPLTKGREAEKAEIRKFSIRDFLKDKPAVARDPEKVKELIEMYDRIKENTGLTKEGVLLDLNRAFAALYHEQLIDAAKTQKFERVKEMELFSSPGVDQGATGYVNEDVKMPAMSADDRKVLAQWGMTPEEWWAMKTNRQ